MRNIIKIKILAERLRPKSTIRKPKIPSLDDKPIMGLKSDKNYVTSNAVDIILMSMNTFIPFSL